MDSTTSLKRRRPHLYDDESFGLYSQTDLSFPAAAISSLSPQQQFVLQQAAAILQLPATELFCLSPQYYNAYIIERAADILNSTPQALIESTYASRSQQKRIRRSIDFSLPAMPSQYIEGLTDQDPEKEDRPTSFMAQNHVNDNRRSFLPLPVAGSSSFLGTTASGVVGCLASLTTCQTSPSHGSTTEYEAILITAATSAAAAPESGQYMGSRPYTTEDPAANLVQISEPYNDGYVAPQVENWLSDDSTESAQYMQNYPALQPTITTPTSAPATSHLTRVQPSTHSESMYYPTGQLPNNFPKTEEAEPIEPIKTIPATTLPGPTASSQHQDGPVEMPIGAIFTGSSLPIAAANPPTIPSPPVLLTANAAFVSAETIAANQAGTMAVSPAEGGQPGSTALSPTAASHYAPIPHAVIHHHHHHLHNRMPIASYIGEANLDISIQSHPRPPAARRGPFKDQTDRQKTAQTRKDGSCIRCRMQRIRCNAEDGNPKGECLGCKKSLSRTWRLPCMRLKISDVVLSKTSQVKGHEWTLRWKENTVLDDVGHWASSEVRMVRISEGYTNEYVELRVRRFVPQDGDSLERSWVTPGGESRSVTIPPYAVIEPESIGPQYSTYIKKGLVACCNNVLGEQKSTLIWPTYWVAVNLSRRSTHLSDSERTLLSNTLDLWMTVRLTTRSFEIVGDETLDMPKDILDETSPSHGKIPIPPVMGAQLDSVLIHQIQHTLKRHALDGLHRLITENKTRTWFTTYLVTFILLHNAALVIKHDASYARKHGIQRRFAREDKVQQYYTGAITLLAYFHYCNKGVFPFTEEAKDQDMRNLASLDEDAMQFVRHTRKYAIANKRRWQTLLETNAYEDDFYFISQLFEVKWQPRAMVV